MIIFRFIGGVLLLICDVTMFLVVGLWFAFVWLCGCVVNGFWRLFGRRLP